MAFAQRIISSIAGLGLVGGATVLASCAGKEVGTAELRSSSSASKSKSNGEYGRQAVMIHNTLTAGMSENKALKNAAFETRVAMWVDGNGRISRVQIGKSTGSSETDEAIRTELTGLQLPETLPADTPMPIYVSLSGGRPL